MKKAELHRDFKISMDKLAASTAFGGCPAFLPAEIDYWLDLAYYQIINTLFTGHNDLQIRFEGSVKRISDLQKLVKTDIIALSKGSYPNEFVGGNFYIASGEKKRLFYVDSVLNINSKSQNTSLLDHATAINFRETYDNKPVIVNPVFTLQDDIMHIYVDSDDDSQTTANLSLTYVKQPDKIANMEDDDYITEVPDYIQLQIVDKATLLALDNIESTRTQTKGQLNQTEE